MVSLATFYGISTGGSTGIANDPQASAAIAAVIDGAGPEGTATSQLLASVDTVIQSSEVRVITDTVQTVSANVVSVDVTADVYLYPDTSASVLDGVEAAIRQAVQDEGGLGWDLTLSWLIKSIHVDGVQRVDMVAPTQNQVAADDTAITIGNFTINNQGYDR